MTKKETPQHLNRELSWLDFNGRVLQEANDSSVPLIERLRFIGIFSNNLDEFFRVRYSTIKRISQSKNQKEINKLQFNPHKLLDDITKKTIQLQNNSQKILETIQSELKKENIFIINEKQLNTAQEEFIKEYFTEKISSNITIIMVNKDKNFSDIKDYIASYIVIKMSKKHNNSSPKYALIEIPNTVDRFIVLPQEDNRHYIILVDDIIRFYLSHIFPMMDYDDIEAHSIQISRDAELHIENNINQSFIQKIYNSVKDRPRNDPVRFVYDKDISEDTLALFMNKMDIEQDIDSMIPGGRYHNDRDYMHFPDLNHKSLTYATIKPLPIKGVSFDENMLNKLDQRDFLQFTPYHSFSYIVKLLREAALDPKVKTIKITLYRLANVSQVINSLVNAKKNGKDVVVLIELQARFNEEANIERANILEQEGIKVIFGVPGLKVHCKLCLIEKVEKGVTKLYGLISNGNFNESTAKYYTDLTLFTSHQEILKDINKVFEFFDINYQVPKYKHLIVSPHYTEKKIHKLIRTEIQNAKNGLPAYIKIRLNNLSNHTMIHELYKASQAGVKIQLIIRGICCLLPQVKGLSENIEVISIVDKYLEHARFMIFGNNDNPKYFISSADLMTRNLKNRVEVTCPVYAKELQQELQDIFDISWRDNLKARVMTGANHNVYKDATPPFVRSQIAIYEYYKNKSNNA